MTTPLHKKSSIDEIKRRFDKDVERFSDINTAQASTIDAPLAMELITQAALHTTANIRNILDIGCGAGNNSVKLLQSLPTLHCYLVDLSMPMLNKAKERCQFITSGNVHIYQGDFRDIIFPQNTFDVIIAAAVLHHLRDDDDWKEVFHKIYALTSPGGSFWITDLVCHENAKVEKLMKQRYGQYLTEVGGEEYKKDVFNYIDKEDSPRPLTYQIDLLREVGYLEVEILHKNSCFAAFGAIKSLE